ncbi:MAG: GNAT family N-acetyltransferase [Anaerolineae bacterium]|nr:GNAT family N-acetyltransferase [Anaerolineae bacterium]
MAAFTNRPYAGDADLQAMIDLLVVARPSGHIADYPGIVDLREMLETAETQANTSLWRDGDGQLVGFAIVHPAHGNLIFEIAQARDGDLAAQMVAWSVERVRNARRESEEPASLQMSCRDDNLGRVALLEQLGFVRQEQYTLHFARALSDPVPEPQVPEGFGIRHLAGEHEVEAHVALHRAAYGTENMTVEERLSWMHTPGYDPELDLVAVAPDGALAAYVFCSISEEENALIGRKDGYTDPVATHPAFQRRGLARALLLTGFRLLKQRGVETARMSTGSWNVAMQRAARSVGYRAASKTIFFEKPVLQDASGVTRGSIR